MKNLFAAGAIAALSACQSITVNGVEVSRTDQAALAAAGIVAGAIIYSASEKDDSAEDQKRPGEIVCKVNIETGDCI